MIRKSVVLISSRRLAIQEEEREHQINYMQNLTVCIHYQALNQDGMAREHGTNKKLVAYIQF
jgi:hypothetical protein